MYAFLIASRNGWLAQDRFMGKVLDEWAIDTQEFVHAKLPHLVIVAIIGFVLSRLLSLIAARMIRIAEAHAASRGRVAQVKTLAGVIRTTGFAVIGAIVSLQFLDAVGVNLAPLLASAGIAGVAIGLAAQNIVKDMLNGTLAANVLTGAFVALAAGIADGHATGLMTFAATKPHSDFA